MSFILRILARLRRPKARYGEDVLSAGWVDIPAALRSWRIRGR